LVESQVRSFCILEVPMTSLTGVSFSKYTGMFGWFFIVGQETGAYLSNLERFF
jgi:hypothetical protein